AHISSNRIFISSRVLEDDDPVRRMNRHPGCMFAARWLMGLEQLQVQGSWRRGRDPMMPTLLTAIHNQDETPVAIHFDRNTPSCQAFGAVRQARSDVRRNRMQPPVSCGHREHHGGGLSATI